MQNTKMQLSKMQICFMTLLLLAFTASFALATAERTDNSQSSQQYIEKLADRPMTGAEDLTALRSAGTSLGDTKFWPLGTAVGGTQYDYQHNGSMGRQIVVSPDQVWVHFVWMKMNPPSPRKIYYNSYNLSLGTFTYGFGYTAGIAISGNNGGYTTIDVRTPPDYEPVVAYHEGASSIMYRTISGYGPPVFSWNTAPPPPNCTGTQSGGFEANSVYIWPVVEWQHVGSDGIRHVVSTESPPAAAEPDEVQSIIYYRYTNEVLDDCPGQPGVQLGRYIDETYTVSAVVRSDPNPARDEMAIVYLKPLYPRDDPMDPCGWMQFQHDVVYIESNDGGVTFNPLVNVTDYTQGGTLRTDEIFQKAYTDLSAVYDSEGNLHIVWNTPNYDADAPCQPLIASKLWHWSEGSCITLVYDASSPAGHCTQGTGAFNLAIAKMNISECYDEIAGNPVGLYVSFTRFGAHLDPADPEANGDCSDAGYANGDIFLTASTDGGQTWGPDPAATYAEGSGGQPGGGPWATGTAIDLTNTWTNGCLAGDCASEHWSSMAKYSVDSLHILYVNDRDAGAGIRNDPQEGVLTDNEMMYVNWPCFAPAEICDVIVEPTKIGHPLFISPQGVPDCTGPETVDFDLTVINTGNIATNYNFTTATPWITPAAVGGIVPVGCVNTETETFTIGPIAVEGTHVGSITLTACGGAVVIQIPVIIHCYCDFYLPEYEILSTACWSIGVWNVPRAGIGPDGDEGNMYWFPDGPPLMYDEGVVITMCDDTTITWFSIFDGSNSNVFFEPRAALVVDQTDPDYEYAMGTFSDHDPGNDPTIWGTIEYYVSKHPAICVLVECITITNVSDDEICIHVGEGIDWDIDPDEGDESGIDAARNMVYQHGAAGFDNENYYGGAKFCNAIVGAKVLDNDTWVYPNEGYVPAEIGGLLATYPGGLEAYVGAPDDLNSFYIIEQNVILQPGESVSYCKVKASSLTGLADLQATIDSGCEWAADNVPCGAPCMPGDANASGNVDIDDVVYLIAYIFTGGPPPVPYLCCGDANGSCGVDIDDVVYLIAYIFTGGPPPAPSCSVCACGIF